MKRVLTVALAAIVAGLVAFIVIRKHNDDEKRDAARAALAEPFANEPEVIVRRWFAASYLGDGVAQNELVEENRRQANATRDQGRMYELKSIVLDTDAHNATTWGASATTWVNEQIAADRASNERFYRVTYFNHFEPTGVGDYDWWIHLVKDTSGRWWIVGWGV